MGIPKGYKWPEDVLAKRRKPRLPLAERFERHFIPEPNSGCWLWFGSIDRKGYGQINVAGKLRVATHIAWSLYRGAAPIGLWVLHRCDNPSCVNPDHLFLGTAKDNTADMMRKGRHDQAGLAVGWRVGRGGL